MLQSPYKVTTIMINKTYDYNDYISYDEANTDFEDWVSINIFGDRIHKTVVD